jgi:hypothetical protein
VVTAGAGAKAQGARKCDLNTGERNELVGALPSKGTIPVGSLSAVVIRELPTGRQLVTRLPPELRNTPHLSCWALLRLRASPRRIGLDIVAPPNWTSTRVEADPFSRCPSGSIQRGPMTAISTSQGVEGFGQLPVEALAGQQVVHVHEDVGLAEPARQPIADATRI